MPAIKHTSSKNRGWVGGGGGEHGKNAIHILMDPVCEPGPSRGIMDHRYMDQESMFWQARVETNFLVVKGKLIPLNGVIKIKK